MAGNMGPAAFDREWTRVFIPRWLAAVQAGYDSMQSVFQDFLDEWNVREGSTFHSRWLASSLSEFSLIDMEHQPEVEAFTERVLSKWYREHPKSATISPFVHDFERFACGLLMKIELLQLLHAVIPKMLEDRLRKGQNWVELITVGADCTFPFLVFTAEQKEQIQIFARRLAKLDREGDSSRIMAEQATFKQTWYTSYPIPADLGRNIQLPVGKSAAKWQAELASAQKAYWLIILDKLTKAVVKAKVLASSE
ncbi:hypothetical protein C8J56DRAFT_1049974 [Mycena floridula]|nr:hypothetical protein C8J56DRAFT_1049974 [Mycena floridula]